MPVETEALVDHIVELIRRSSCGLPDDVKEAIARAADDEEEGSRAQNALRLVLRNVAEAEEGSTPTCQDTGTLIFHVEYGPEHRQRPLRQVIEAACRGATAKQYLRPNAVDPVTGKNSGDNTGDGAPFIDFVERDEPGLHIALLQKGGGCENVSGQYSLPNGPLGAGRDLEGVRRVVLDAVHKAQGRGCAPGILGIGLGGDRMSSHLEAKMQLYRRLDDVNADPDMAALEARLLREGNELGIGPMGFGGQTTLLGVKVGRRHRVPASYFVSIAYMCWASRRAALHIDADGIASFN
jgi:fumarate hydratase, class I